MIARTEQRVNLDPPNYMCPEHGGDLTALVVEALEEQPIRTAYRRIGRRRGPEPFDVLVSCPGTGPGTAHDLAFDGWFSP